MTPPPNADSGRVIKAMAEHEGLHDFFGRYQGGCLCGWEGEDIYGHMDDVLAAPHIGRSGMEP